MRYLLFGTVIFLLTLSAHGQSDGRIYTFQDHYSVFGKNNISLSLAPLIRQGFEVSYDRRIIERHWLKLAPVYFRKEDYSPSTPTDLKRMQGYGFKFQHKYFPYANTDSKMGIFLSYGPGFQRFDIETKDGQFLSFDKMGFECVIGMRKVFNNVFYFEFYGGLAANVLNVRKDETINWRLTLQEYNTMWFDFGKTGNFMTFGFSLGILF